MIRLIAALDRQRGIGKHGGQPWKIPDDEAYFARCTKADGGHILVGSTTFKTFHRPLLDRKNYVLTHHEESITGAEIVHDLSNFLDNYADKVLWVIGDANVFHLCWVAGKA